MKIFRSQSRWKLSIMWYTRWLKQKSELVLDCWWYEAIKDHHYTCFPFQGWCKICNFSISLRLLGSRMSEDGIKQWYKWWFKKKNWPKLVGLLMDMWGIGWYTQTWFHASLHLTSAPHLTSPGKVPDLEQIQIWHVCSRSGTINPTMHCTYTFRFKFQTSF